MGRPNSNVRNYSGAILTAPILVAFVGMFLEGRLPFLHPFILWTFRIYAGMFIVCMVGLLVVPPGVFMAEDLLSTVVDSSASVWEKRLSVVWCAGAGVLFTALIAAAYALQAIGRVVDIKLWFIALCFVVLMIPYSIMGYVIRWVAFRRNNKRGPTT